MLTTGWYDFKIVKRLRDGDKLQCEIEDPPTYMNIKEGRSLHQHEQPFLR
jgi:hypothetical protein